MNENMIFTGLALTGAGIGGQITVGFPFLISGSLGGVLVILGFLF